MTHEGKEKWKNNSAEILSSRIRVQVPGDEGRNSSYGVASSAHDAPENASPTVPCVLLGSQP